MFSDVAASRYKLVPFEMEKTNLVNIIWLASLHSIKNDSPDRPGSSRFLALNAVVYRNGAKNVKIETNQFGTD